MNRLSQLRLLFVIYFCGKVIGDISLGGDIFNDAFTNVPIYGGRHA